MSRDFQVTITDPQRREDFIAVFGTATVAVESPIPEYAALPGLEDQRVYKLDLQLITAEQRQRLIQHLSNRFNIKQSEIDELLDEDGMPIPVASCILTIDHPLRWFD